MSQSKQGSSSINIAEIQKLAKESTQDGAITQDYALDLEEAIRLLNDALATEIMCVLRYRHHQIIASGIDRPQVAAEFLEHALDEERHMMMIAERINQLGGDPDFDPSTIVARTATEYGSGKDLEKLIEENLIAERVAIMVYRSMVQWFGSEDSTTRRMLEEILQDEEHHADDLADLISK
ncbi:MAG: ferritin-like domain-containing protein [Gammaproteobacteria bacterium]|nr:ferritin-like domain-containing protein [Gammaproteobacteria bacterium]